MKKLIIGVAGILGAIVAVFFVFVVVGAVREIQHPQSSASATGSSKATPAPTPCPCDLSGTLTAPDCGGGYNLDGAAVTVRNEKDEIIGSGTANARMTRDSNNLPSCEARFHVKVADAKFYQIKVGTHTGPSYSLDDLRAKNFDMTLSLK